MKPKDKNLIVSDGLERIVYQGKIIEVVEKPVKIGHKKRTFEIARRTPGVRLIILSKDKSKVLLSREHRREHNSWDYRLPGGKVFDTLDEYNQFLKSNSEQLPQIETAAQREAREEVGVQITSMTHFVTTKAGSTIDWDLWYFVVEDFEELEVAQLGEGENIENAWVSLDEAQEFALSGEMKEDRSVAVLLRYLHSLGTTKTRP